SVAAVLVALGDDGVALEDEEAGVLVRVEKLVEAEVRRAADALQRTGLRRPVHAVRRVDLVHVAPQVDELRVRRRSGNRETWGEEDDREKSGKLQAALSRSFLIGRTFSAETISLISLVMKRAVIGVPS